MGRTDSYLICATPRTGSTLLCGLLASAEVAGRPESYFRQPDEQMWAARWDIVRSSDGVFEYSEFVRAALAAGRTENGVFAARIMWGTLDYMVDKLGAVYPAITGGDIDLLNRAFGHTRFVYLQRDDVLAQAVSWHRAEQAERQSLSANPASSENLKEERNSQWPSQEWVDSWKNQHPPFWR